MSDEHPPPDEGTNAAADDPRRPQSTIKFPYVGLDDVSGIADVMLNSYGGRCSVVQLASALDQKPSSGAFRVKVTAAKMFGVVSGRGENLLLTPLGSALVDTSRSRKARVDAFLGVPLYGAMYEEATRNGGVMPGSIKGVEEMITRLGVVQGQAETARLAFTRSARFAGFFEHGNDKLVMPSMLDGQPSAESAEPEVKPVPITEAPADSLPGKPTILVEVFKRLPDEGETWTYEERGRWGVALKAMLDLIYPESSVKPDPAEPPDTDRQVQL